VSASLGRGDRGGGARVVRRRWAGRSFALGALGLAVVACFGQGGAGLGRGLYAHDSFFKVAGSHATLDCYACHDPSATTFAASGNGVSCLGCHTEDDVLMSGAHGAVIGYAYDTATCIACHKDGASSVDHGPLFPIARGTTHGATACPACHGVSKARGDLLCAGCHVGAAPHADRATVDANHQGLPGYSYSSPVCYDCHKDGGIPDFDHDGLTKFPISTGSVHAGIGCSSCHGATKAVANLRCTSCHVGARPHGTQALTDSLHATVSGYVYASPACYGCHKNGSLPLPTNHNVDYFPVTGTKHATSACSQCHGKDKLVASLTCTSGTCHPQSASAAQHAAIPTVSRGSITNYSWTPAYCVRCHGNGQVNRIASHPRSEGGIDGENHSPFCLTCHPSLRRDKTWAADFSSNSCSTCHR